jgi:hypothetical protein
MIRFEKKVFTGFISWILIEKPKYKKNPWLASVCAWIYRGEFQLVLEHLQPIFYFILYSPIWTKTGPYWYFIQSSITVANFIFYPWISTSRETMIGMRWKMKNINKMKNHLSRDIESKEWSRGWMLLLGWDCGASSAFRGWLDGLVLALDWDDKMTGSRHESDQREEKRGWL